jgi:flagellar hook-associated protein 1
MQYSQLALGTISHNVVNANTTGYSRQIVQASASSVAGYGTGVQLDSIQRITDRFLVSRMLTAGSDSAYATTKSSYMTSLENTLSSAGSGGGLESIVGNFTSSMSSLANDPSNSSLRRSTVEQAELTAQALNNTATDLQQVATDADNEITSELDTVNQLLKDIYQLGRQISEQNTSANGGNTNDLMDARDQKITQLSQTFGIQVNYDAENNGVRILTESGRKLVDSSGYVQLSRGTAASGGYATIVAQNVRQDGSLAEAKMVFDPADMTTGKIKALAEIRDEVVPDLMSQLNEFTETFTTALNKLSSQGTSYPPQASLTSANTADLAAPTTNLLTNGFASLSGATINISTTTTVGGVTNTTVGTPITLTPVAGALSLQDIADQINNDPNIGNAALGGTAGVIATAATDTDGNPYLKIEAADTNARVVMANAGTTDVLGSLGMNNLFTGTTAATVSVRSDISANPDRFPVARMNSTGGVSSTDGQNIVAMAQIGDTRLTFDAAGSLGTQTTTGVSYLNTLTSNLAVSTSAARDNETFASNLYSQSQDQVTSTSGVNLNEELAEMLVYQNSFQASSRIINVVNDLLQELMNII